MVKNLFCKAGDVDCIPGWRTKIPHGLEQLRQRATTREPEGLQPRPNVCMLRRFSGVRLYVTLWTIACQAPLSIGFSRQEYWSGLLCPSPGNLPDSGNEPASLTSLALAGGFFTTSATWEAPAKSRKLKCTRSVNDQR